MSKIDKLTIKGFKSIRSLDQFQLNNLNVLIGANGVGKSNFVGYFKMLHELVEGRLQLWCSKQGGADRVLSYGVKETSALLSVIRFGDNGYAAELISTADSAFTFNQEKLYFDGPYFGVTEPNLGSGHKESNLKAETKGGTSAKVAQFCYETISGWKVFHFHDTSDTAAMKRIGSLHDNDYLRTDASNLAAYLYKLSKDNTDVYNQICKTVRLAVPFFDDFVLKPTQLESGEEQIRLLWRQANSDYALWPSQLSDGSIRFICLVTALLQPCPPSTIIIDEPELGLHPYAITLLGALLRSASLRMQVIVSTQSVPLLNEFELDDLIVVEREDGASIFKRLDAEKFNLWLEDYSVGELWEKNLLGGRPSK
ncbi:MAG: putative ATPase [Alteromonadaceae bacterium]|jgi:predicted ATPase